MAVLSRRGRDCLPGPQGVRPFGCTCNGRFVENLHRRLRGEGTGDPLACNHSACGPFVCHERPDNARCNFYFSPSHSCIGSPAAAAAPREHQLELLARARAGRPVLLIAPTGAGESLAGFLPSLVELSAAPRALSRRDEEARGGLRIGAARAERPNSTERTARLVSTGRSIRRRRATHPLHFSAQGARSGHRPEPGAPGRRNGTADPD